ncbi:sterile20-like kinase isoform X6 [Oratosquilla oratoria]|uniref:sterile20-like kinase isoform X6 n=1 Tax=Oratosquilla oratoria TaxID=337810 RepID=UPI003F7627C5
MMPLLSKVKDIFKGSASNKKKKVFHNVKIESPEEYWDIIGELGDGAYGKVYKAQHKEHHTLAALKQVKLEAEEDLETFMIEIDILSECKHENIVQLLEAYHFDGYLWMYLEYCDGGAVDSIMADLDRPLTEPQIAYLCQNLCHALKYVHDNKVIHRDLKAGNVLLMMDGGVKLADFGVSAKNKNTLDKRGTFIGTPYWLAPEVILCETFIDAKYDYKADIWSLGISLIEFAQMDPPNHEVSPVRVMLKIQKSDPPKLDYPTKYSREFNDFVAKCLVKDPNQRPSAEDLLKHPFLDKVLDAKPIIDLLLEYKAEVVEEEVVEDLEEQRISTQSLDSEEQSVNSHDDTESIASCNIVGDKISHVESEEMVVSPRRNIKEVPTAVSGERRLSKGPAPSPPISQASTPSTPTAPSQPSSTASTPSKKESKEGITEVTISTSPDQGHRLDASEVVISNSSILHDNEEVEPVTKSKYEITLEEVSEAEQDTRESIPRADDTHISVVTVDDQAPGTTVTVTPGPVTAKTKSPTSDSSDQQNVDTSSNISNMSNISMTSHSTTGGRSVSSGGVCAEEVEEQNEGRPTSLVIEGTTVGATDVDDDVFDHSDQHDNKTPTSAKTSISQDSALESETSGSTSSQQRTPKTHSISSSTSTSQTSTPAHHIVQNGSIGKDNHIISDSKSDTDSISTASSEKENTKPKQRLDNGENFEEVVLRPHHRQKDSSGAFKPADRHNKEGRTAEELETMALRKKTRKRTRKFVIDGVVVTTTTSKVIYGDDEEKGTLSSGHLARKQELRELKILQKMEQKQFQELAVKANFAKQEQEKKFDVEKQQLLRSYEVELESLNRQQKQQVERAEYQQELDLKQTSKKIRAEQEKELKAFRDSLKTELKLLKQEIDLLPKDKRKDNFKVRREKLDQDQNERERSFLEGLHESHETMLKRLGDSHREKIAMLEQQFLQQKHQLLRQRESALWEMEEKHLHEKHQLAKRQLKDIFFLQRHQMLLRHDKELEQVKRVNQQKEEDLIKRQQIEKRQLPKRIRQEMKARELMFRESMRISISHLPDSHEDEKERLKKFQEGEKRRYEAEKRRAEQKHRKQLEELLAASDSTIKELEQLQNEKRKVLMEHETFKLKCQDEDYQKELKEWKTNLKPRKQKLEEEFEKQLKEQQQFYGAYLTRSSLVGLESNSTTSLTKA